VIISLNFSSPEGEEFQPSPMGTLRQFLEQSGITIKSTVSMVLHSGKGLWSLA